MAEGKDPAGGRSLPDRWGDLVNAWTSGDMERTALALDRLAGPQGPGSRENLALALIRARQGHVGPAHALLDRALAAPDHGSGLDLDLRDLVTLAVLSVLEDAVPLREAFPKADPEAPRRRLDLALAAEHQVLTQDLGHEVSGIVGVQLAAARSALLEALGPRSQAPADAVAAKVTETLVLALEAHIRLVKDRVASSLSRRPDAPPSEWQRQAALQISGGPRASLPTDAPVGLDHLLAVCHLLVEGKPLEALGELARAKVGALGVGPRDRLFVATIQQSGPESIPARLLHELTDTQNELPPRTRDLVARALLVRGDPAGAVRAWQNASPGTAEARLVFALALARCGRRADASSHLQALVDRELSRPSQGQAASSSNTPKSWLEPVLLSVLADLRSSGSGRAHDRLLRLGGLALPRSFMMNLGRLLASLEAASPREHDRLLQSMSELTPDAPDQYDLLAGVLLDERAYRYATEVGARWPRNSDDPRRTAAIDRLAREWGATRPPPREYQAMYARLVELRPPAPIDQLRLGLAHCELGLEDGEGLVQQALLASLTASEALQMALSLRGAYKGTDISDAFDRQSLALLDRVRPIAGLPPLEAAHVVCAYWVGGKSRVGAELLNEYLSTTSDTDLRVRFLSLLTTLVVTQYEGGDRVGRSPLLDPLAYRVSQLEPSSTRGRRLRAALLVMQAHGFNEPGRTAGTDHVGAYTLLVSQLRSEETGLGASDRVVSPRVVEDGGEDDPEASPARQRFDRAARLLSATWLGADSRLVPEPAPADPQCDALRNLLSECLLELAGDRLMAAPHVDP